LKPIELVGADNDNDNGIFSVKRDSLRTTLLCPPELLR
jgi:hypothetical protein